MIDREREAHQIHVVAWRDKATMVSHPDGSSLPHDEGSGLVSGHGSIINAKSRLSILASEDVAHGQCTIHNRHFVFN